MKKILERIKQLEEENKILKSVPKEKRDKHGISLVRAELKDLRNIVKSESMRRENEKWKRDKK